MLRGVRKKWSEEEKEERKMLEREVMSLKMTRSRARSAHAE
jgi:hypothetical protein